MNRSCGLTHAKIEERMLAAFEKGSCPTVLILNQKLSESICRYFSENNRFIGAKPDFSGDHVSFLMTQLGSLQLVVDHSQDHLDSITVMLTTSAGDYVDNITDIDPAVEFNA